MTVRVGINGYGTIGKRVACAVKAQDDMEIVGVTKPARHMKHDWQRWRSFPCTLQKKNRFRLLKKEGIATKGSLKDLLEVADIIVDCTPGGVGERYRKMYEEAGVKAIFQGGEEHGLTGVSFNAFANYSEAWGRQFCAGCFLQHHRLSQNPLSH